MHEHDKTALEIVRRPPTVIVPCRFSVDEHAELKAFADKHGATSKLTPEEIKDLAEYVLSL